MPAHAHDSADSAMTVWLVPLACGMTHAYTRCLFLRANFAVEHLLTLADPNGDCIRLANEANAVFKA